MNRETDMTKLIVAFRSFSTVPKKDLGYSSAYQRFETGTFLKRV
jgi:hypothetical protein